MLSFLLFLLTYISIQLFIKNADNFGLIDIPNHRSTHTQSIATGAGMVFGAFFLLALIITHYFIFPELNMHSIYFFLPIVYVIGIYDDFFNITPSTKFLFIVITAVIAYYSGFSIDNVGTCCGHKFSLGLMALPFTVFAITGFTNSLNLIDGLDGLAGSISVIILLSLTYIGYQHADSFMISVSLLLIIVTVAFLLLNWYPAKVFMGDSGSLLLGFTLALLMIYALKYITPTSIFFLGAIPLLDTFVTMYRRIQIKQSIFVADRRHLHHILLKIKKDKKITVILLLLMQVFFSLIFIQVYDKSDIINLLSFVSLFFIFLNLFDPRIEYRE